MNDLKQRVCEAFDEVELPSQVRAHTLAAIDTLAAQQAAKTARETSIQPPAPAASASAPSPARRARPVVWRRVVVALAACIALIAVGFVGTKLYFEETAFVAIDVNPSVELGINRFNLVVSAKAFNADGEALLNHTALTNMRYEDAVAALTSSGAFAPYLEQDAFVEISVVSANTQQSDTLRTQSDACLRNLPCEGSCHAVDEDTREAALAANMGVGRYETALQLLELDPTLTLEDCAALSMRELRERIAALSDTASGAPGASASEENSPNEQGRGFGRGADGNLGKHQGGKGGKGHHAE